MSTVFAIAPIGNHLRFGVVGDPSSRSNYRARARGAFIRARQIAGEQLGGGQPLSQPEFAKALNNLTGRRTGASQISEYENGHTELPAALLLAAADLVKMTVDQLASEGSPDAQYRMIVELMERVDRLERRSESDD